MDKDKPSGKKRSKRIYVYRVFDTASQLYVSPGGKDSFVSVSSAKNTYNHNFKKDYQPNFSKQTRYKIHKFILRYVEEL